MKNWEIFFGNGPGCQRLGEAGSMHLYYLFLCIGTPRRHEIKKGDGRGLG